MKAIFVEEKTIDSTWYKLLSEIYQHGRINRIDSGSFEGSTSLEFDDISGVIQYPTTRPLAPIMPEGLPVVTTDEDIEKYFVNYLMDGINLEDNEHYRYATWISGGKYKIPTCRKTYDEGKRYSGTWITVPNQIQWCIDHYKNKGFGNRHCYIQVGYPESNIAYDVPYKDEDKRGTSPCLRGIDTAIRKINDIYVLDFHVYFRSWDLYAAFPENMGGITMLMEYMADELEIEVGSLAFSSLKLHCYSHSLEILKKRLGK